MQKGKQNCTITFHEDGNERIYKGYVENPEQFKISEDEKISLQSITPPDLPSGKFK